MLPTSPSDEDKASSVPTVLRLMVLKLVPCIIRIVLVITLEAMHLRTVDNPHDLRDNLGNELLSFWTSEVFVEAGESLGAASAYFRFCK